MESISLSELATKIGQGIKRALPQDYWIVAEISEIQVNRTGHCYLNLIEKPDEESNPIAEMRAIIWANKYRIISPYFEDETGCQLSVGMKIMVLVTVEFHAIYGISLCITDINPVYTIGEEEQRRMKIIRQLEEDGVMDMNKSLELPSVIQRIAVISSETAAGYQDFMNQLADNQYNIKFKTELFSAFMQGEQTESSIVSQLDCIAQREADFDAVVIIRGGGSRADLRWFDNYNIANNIAQFPLPVITGIGHDKDLSIADMVANTSVKTPTAVAEFIIDICGNFVALLEEQQENLEELVASIVEEEREKISDFSNSLMQILKISLLKAENTLNSTRQSLQHIVKQRVLKENSRIDLLAISLKTKNPQEILQQGYTISTLQDGSIIRSSKNLKRGEKITTHFSDGTVCSTVD